MIIEMEENHFESIKQADRKKRTLSIVSLLLLLGSDTASSYNDSAVVLAAFAGLDLASDIFVAFAAGGSAVTAGFCGTTGIGSSSLSETGSCLTWKYTRTLNETFLIRTEHTWTWYTFVRLVCLDRVERVVFSAGAFFSLAGLAGGGTNAGGGILSTSPTSSSDSSIGAFTSIATISNESFCG